MLVHVEVLVSNLDMHMCGIRFHFCPNHSHITHKQILLPDAENIPAIVF